MTAPLPGAAANTAVRAVHFYRVANRVRAEDGAIEPFDPTPLCEAVADLKGAERYMVLDDGSEIAAWLDRDTDRDRLILARIKRTDLPLTETRGGERGILTLLEEQGIAEVVHVLFLPNNVVGIDFNIAGPRPTKLRDYAQDRLVYRYRNFTMAPIIDRDAMERLARVARVKSLELTLSGHTLATLPQRQTDNYIQVLRQLPAMGDAGAVTIAWKPSGRSEVLDAASMRALVIHLLQNRAALDKKSRIVLKGFNAEGGREEFNLLRDVVVSKQNIVKMQRSRTVDSRDAFRAIANAYNEMRDRFPQQLFLN